MRFRKRTAAESSEFDPTQNIYVALVVYDLNADPSKGRILEIDGYHVEDTTSLVELPLMGQRAGEKILEGMVLEAIGRRRSGL